MMYNKDTYFFDNQIQKYILQFMRVFSYIHVQFDGRDGNPGELAPVPVTYGSRDRVAASILSNNTQNTPLRLPICSAYMRSLTQAPERNKGVGMLRQSTYLPKGGIMPTDLQTVSQLMPVPYKLDMELAIMTSNLQTQFQLLEQILSVFNPSVQIQTTDATYDWTKLTHVELVNVSYEENYPMGADRRIPVTTLTFTMPVYLSIPTVVRADIVKDIYLRIGAVNEIDHNDGYGILDSIKDQPAELIISAEEIFGKP